MRRRGILKFLLAFIVTLLALEVDGLDDSIAMESIVDKVEDNRRMEGFDWSFITGQQRNMQVEGEPKQDNFNWNFNSESSEDEEDEDYADRRMDHDLIDWGFNTPVSDEVEDEADKRLDDWSFLTENISNEEEDKAEHRMDGFDWSWNTPGGSSAEEVEEVEEDDDEIEEKLGDVRELIDYREGHEHSHEHEPLPPKWLHKLKRTKSAYGPPKVQKTPKGHQYGPPKTIKRPKPQYGAPKATKRPSYGAPKAPKRTKPKYGAPKKTRRPSKGKYGPPKTVYRAHAQSQEPSYVTQQHQAPVSNNPPQSAYKESEPVTYQPQQQASNPLPPAYRQPELASDDPPPTTNYPTTPDYSSSVIIAVSSPSQSQSSPAAAYDPVVSTQNDYTTPNVASYESRTHSPPTRSEIISPYFRPTEPPIRQRLGQSSSYELVSDKNDNPGFFQYANFPNFDDIFKQIFKF
uniref:Uncharacterized protein n=1 Tax=Daphnia galeata TaxID=27404 RepID=A0A8J2RIG2_9CRUS|nr:unnamed protein product [Daphnia galeata]